MKYRVVICIHRMQFNCMLQINFQCVFCESISFTCRMRSRIFHYNSSKSKQKQIEYILCSMNGENGIANKLMDGSQLNAHACTDDFPVLHRYQVKYYRLTIQLLYGTNLCERGTSHFRFDQKTKHFLTCATTFFIKQLFFFFSAFVLSSFSRSLVSCFLFSFPLYSLHGVK